VSLISVCRLASSFLERKQGVKLLGSHRVALWQLGSSTYVRNSACCWIRDGSCAPRWAFPNDGKQVPAAFVSPLQYFGITTHSKITRSIKANYQAAAGPRPGWRRKLGTMRCARLNRSGKTKAEDLILHDTIEKAATSHEILKRSGFNLTIVHLHSCQTFFSKNHLHSTSALQALKLSASGTTHNSF
jgi:hypothetical protein